MNLFLDRVNAYSPASHEFTFEFASWIANMIDILNEVINAIQNAFNLLEAPQYTATQIGDMFTAGTLSNGILLYDTTNDEYVGMQAGALVKFTTTAYP